MTSQLNISVGQYSDKGRKKTNQDFHGATIPHEPQLGAKGIVIAIADGISASSVSQIASETAVASLLTDYYCTSDAWSVKTAVERVLVATNSWLYSQTQQGEGRYDKDRGFVCTLSAMVIKSTTAHLFHVGDARIYRVHDKTLEQLTCDHRVQVAQNQSYLSRALGVDRQLEIDYQAHPVERGDLFLLATDGVYEYASAASIAAAIHGCDGDLDRAARAIVAEAYRQGSADNLTVQIVRVDELPQPQAGEMVRQLAGLPFPPILEARTAFDGYRILREVHGSSRSHIYLATDDSGQRVIIKAPSIDLQHDAAYVERFLMEEWVARRINSAHVQKPCAQTRKRNFVYLVTEYIEGQTLAQWMTDHPKPDLQAVRAIIEQVARGVRAFHRLDMLHQDLRPDNVMIDGAGTVKIIDFGSARVAGVIEAGAPQARHTLLGAALYAAPEYFLGEEGSMRADVFSLGVMTYQMLTGRLPYGAEVPKCKSRSAQRRLVYRPAAQAGRPIPPWVDEAIKKAVHPEPSRRYAEVAEFVYDLHHPNPAFLRRSRQPLIERDPLTFWKGASFVLAVLLLIVLALKSAAP